MDIGKLKQNMNKEVAEDFLQQTSINLNSNYLVNPQEKIDLKFRKVSVKQPKKKFKPMDTTDVTKILPHGKNLSKN